MLIKLSPQDEHLRSIPWGVSTRRKYPLARVNGIPTYLHRLIMGAQKGQIVDHINGDPLDNRRDNLRICDFRGSNQNRRAKRTSKAPYKGITQLPSGRWLAQIMSNGKHHKLGVFEAPEEAAEAYRIAAERLHGEFANTGCSDKDHTGTSGLRVASQTELQT